MALEACSLDLNDERRVDLVDFSIIGHLNGRKIDTKGGDITHYRVRGYAMQGWGRLNQQVKPMSNSIGGSAQANIGSKGEPTVSGEVHITAKDEDGSKVTASAQGSVKSDSDGNIQTDATIKVSFETPF